MNVMEILCVCVCVCVCVCLSVYGRPVDLIKVCFNEHGLSNKNNGHLLQSACCVCGGGGGGCSTTQACDRRLRDHHG